MSQLYRSDLLDIEGQVLRETERAILFTDGKVTVWLPKSAIEIEHGSVRSSVTVTLPEQLAIEKELA